MSATFVVVPHDHAEVKHVVGDTREITRVVASRSEDIAFALDLGRVLLSHVERLAELDATSPIGDTL